MINAQKLWTKDFILSSFAGFFSAMVLYITTTTFALYAAKTFQVNAGMAGLTASVFVIGSVLGRIFGGRYIELIGRRKLVLMGGVVFFLVSFLYLIPLNIGLLLLVRFVHGTAFGIVHNSLATIVISFIPPHRRGEGIGYFSLNFVFATALGPLTGLFLIQQFGYTALFLACILCALLSLVLACLIHIENPALSEAQRGQLKQRISLHDVFEKEVLPIAVIIIIMSMCYTSVTTFIASYTAELQLSNVAQLFFVIYAAVILIVRPLAGRLLDKKGDNIVMIPTIAFFALSLLLLGFAHHAYLFVLAAVFMAFGYGNILNVGQAIAVKMVARQPHKIGIATSTYFVFSDAGMGLGPLVMGWLAARQGFAAMFMVDGVVVAAAILLYYGLHGRKVRARARL